jgi:hypothetical protein
MYFVLVIGTIELMRWMAFAANCLLDSLSPRSGMSGARFRGAKQIR